mmetsp:Transcript_6516/g.8061  ORF Transcript_6516/g.8061 Transcript_6516/m.8061 type:complete len:81 (-) Transcript_6516:488-730(-)
MGPPCDPVNEWTINNGSLYCNYMSEVTEQFRAGINEMVAEADQRWSLYYGALAAGPMNTGCFADCFSTTCNCKESCSYCG